MTYTIKTTKSVEDVIRKWKKSNPKLFKKYEKIYLELSEHPRTGIGHPEPLVGGDFILYSRHISAHDRIIYEIHEDIITVLVLDVEGHYDDK